MNRLKPFIAVALGLSFLFLSGCRDLKELNHSSFITGLALEPGETSKFKVTIEVLNASEAQSLKGGKGSAPTIVQSMEANTVAEAVMRLNERMDRDMNVSHTGVVIIDERLARHGLNTYIDVLQRSRFLREEAMILISKDTPASALLKVLYPRGAYSSYKIMSQVFNNQRTWGGAQKSRLFDLNSALAAKGREPLLTAITLKGSPDANHSAESMKSISPASIVELAGTAVFHKDRLVGFLSQENSRMVQIASGHANETTLSVPMDKPGEYASIRIYNIRSRKEVSINGRKPSIRLVLNAEGVISGTDTEVNLQDVSGYQKVEELTSAYLKQQLNTMIKVTQHEMGVDVVGFGEKLYRWHYKQFEPVAADWNELYAGSEVEIAVHAALRRSELKTEHIIRVENQGNPTK